MLSICSIVWWLCYKKLRSAERESFIVSLKKKQINRTVHLVRSLTYLLTIGKIGTTDRLPVKATNYQRQLIKFNWAEKMPQVLFDMLCLDYITLSCSYMDIKLHIQTVHKENFNVGRISRPQIDKHTKFTFFGSSSSDNDLQQEIRQSHPFPHHSYSIDEARILHIKDSNFHYEMGLGYCIWKPQTLRMRWSWDNAS